MNVTVVCTDSDHTFHLNVQNDLLVEDFKALCSADLNVLPETLLILYNGRPLINDKDTLDSYGIKDNDMVLVQKIKQQNTQASPFRNIDLSNITVPGSSNAQHQPASSFRPPDVDNPALIRQKILSNSRDLAILKERNPVLAEAAIKGDREFALEYNKLREAQREEERQRIRMLNADPFDKEVQKKIAEEIKMKNIQENMNMAIEESPESFGQVYMLWIDCKVNNHKIKAFVDSGAQMTIMSSACAERCNIMRLVDKRWEGIAKGVGVQKIIGRVHLAQLQIENDFLPCSYSLLEDQPMDMLLGLDMLKRHQCVIDLRENCLKIGTTGTKTRFLAEREIPSHGRLHDPNSSAADNHESMETDMKKIEDQEIAKAMQKSAEEASRPMSGVQSTSQNNSVNNPPSEPAAGPGGSNLPEEKLKKLMDMGFSRADSEAHLQKCNGNVEMAIVKLLARSLKPK